MSSAQAGDWKCVVSVNAWACLFFESKRRNEELTAGADDDYTRSHVCGYLERKRWMRDVKDGSRESSRSRQKSETDGNKSRGRDSMVGSLVDWRGGEMPRWTSGAAVVVSASGVWRVERWNYVMLSGNVERKAAVVAEEVIAARRQ